MTTVNINGVSREMTAEEQAEFDAQQTAWNSKSANRKLTEIKSIRNQKLQETDFYALSDVTMSDAMSTYRQNLRNIPQDYTTENEYDLLLARDEQGNLTHTIWEKP
jgi:enterochelin esterase-like enzyme